jgi:hypothetical protein
MQERAVGRLRAGGRLSAPTICRFRRSHERRRNGGLSCLDDRHRQIDVSEPRLVDVLAATGREVIEDAR